ncbi:FMN-binding negative transcriptional regulator [Peredibacter starrii]|uniref:FMN-binding negative transcriptional regulator n=1 Tax=Peredibacter starrii TaxID=28202 RepID=A0AAX4HMG9_9BACT|nr:FMN-binding negative transcriptional regulator [Peredibacter starrii]WPU64537.1 FMN-binding negative transcriptional regulator [Peredibacter starrii]
MYRPKVFAEDRIEYLHRFIHTYPLGLIITQNINAGILANFIPASLHQDGSKGTLRFHLARMNSQVESLRTGNDVLVVFNGPNAYVTPEAYPTKKRDGKAVPTWNYSMVQVRGKSKVIDDPQWILKQINDLTNASEARVSSNWKVSDAPTQYIENQLKLLIGLEIEISQIEGKFKVSQNQVEENRQGVEEYFNRIGNSEMANFVAKKGALK